MRGPSKGSSSTMLDTQLWRRTQNVEETHSAPTHVRERLTRLAISGHMFINLCQPCSRIAAARWGRLRQVFLSDEIVRTRYSGLANTAHGREGGGRRRWDWNSEDVRSTSSCQPVTVVGLLVRTVGDATTLTPRIGDRAPGFPERAPYSVRQM